MKENFPVALKIGKPVARQAAKEAKAYLASECPLAALHIQQGLERLGGDDPVSVPPAKHPIELFAAAYGL
jgi:glycerol-3-phosphate dehydrogenase subunit C